MDRHTQVFTYSGCQLALPDEPQHSYVHPHNVSTLNTIKELSGLSPKGDPVPNKPSRPSKKRIHRWEWQKTGTLCDAARMQKVSLQRFKRIFLERNERRKKIERRAKPKKTYAEGGFKRLDAHIASALRKIAADSDCASKTRGVLERALREPGEGLPFEKLEQKVVRLSRPKIVRVMPWSDGYEGSPDQIWADKSWENCLRTLDWKAELALKQKRDEEDRRAEARMQRDASKVAPPQTPPPPPNPPEVKVKRSDCAVRTAEWLRVTHSLTPTPPSNSASSGSGSGGSVRVKVVDLPREGHVGGGGGGGGSGSGRQTPHPPSTNSPARASTARRPASAGNLLRRKIASMSARYQDDMAA